MRLDRVIAEAIEPAFELMGRRFDSPRARVMLLAIGLQESRFEHTDQVDASNMLGPALGWWQFERAGGTKGVMNHVASHDHARALCSARDVPFDVRTVWMRLKFDQILAAGFARLLLYTDPDPLPQTNDVDGAWRYYLDNWRPGKPHRHTWDALHAQARQAVSE